MNRFRPIKLIFDDLQLNIVICKFKNHL